MNKHAAALGRMTSEKKTRAARANAQKPRKPLCSKCKHTIMDHRYRRPSRDGTHAPRRTECRISGCICTYYVPDVSHEKPVNPRIGRAIRPAQR